MLVSLVSKAMSVRNPMMTTQDTTKRAGWQSARTAGRCKKRNDQKALLKENHLLEVKSPPRGLPFALYIQLSLVDTSCSCFHGLKTTHPLIQWLFRWQQTFKADQKLWNEIFKCPIHWRFLLVFRSWVNLISLKGLALEQEQSHFPNTFLFYWTET